MLDFIKKNSINFKNGNINLNFIYINVSIFIIFFVIYYLKIKYLNQYHIYNQSFYEIILFIFVFIFTVFIESFKKNILLRILIFFCFSFFILRIPTSIIFYESSIFYKRGIDSIELKNSMITLTYQYFVLSFSIIIINPTFKFKSNFTNKKLIDFFLNILIILIFANILFNLFGSINYQSYSKFLTVIFNVFNSLRLNIFFSVLIIFVHQNNLRIKYFIFKIIIFYLFFIFDTTLNGSRSGFFTIVLNLFLLYSCYVDKIEIKFKNIIPILLLILILITSFSFVTSFKSYNNYLLKDKLDLEKKIKDYNSKVHFFSHKEIPSDTEFLIAFFKRNFFSSYRSLLDRIGYLDFYLEKLSNSNYYDEEINLLYYYKPLVDRLSPGIDLYNVPFSSKTFQENYFNKFYHENNINKKYVAYITNSEQITLFAESHILFGKYSIIYYLLILSFFKYLVQYVTKFNSIFRELNYGLILIIFFDWLSSFGLDMVITLSIYKYVCLFLIYILFVVYTYVKNSNFSLINRK